MKLLFRFETKPYLFFSEKNIGVALLDSGECLTLDGLYHFKDEKVSKEIRKIITRNYENLRHYENFEDFNVSVDDGSEEKLDFLDLHVEGPNLTITNSLIKNVCSQIIDVFKEHNYEMVLPDLILEEFSDSDEESNIFASSKNFTEKQRSSVADTENNSIIEGGPGTGKTSLALLKAMLIKERKPDAGILILVYNRPLKYYIEQLAESLNLDIEVETYHSFVPKFYKYIGKTAPRMISNRKDEDQLDCDNYDKVKADFAAENAYYYSHIILDEAQDFPLGLISALKEIGKYMTCFIDDNQGCFPYKTSVEGIKRILGIQKVYELTESFRCKKAISECAESYLQRENYEISITDYSEYVRIIQCPDENSYYENENDLMASIINDNPDKKIGIIVNNKSLINTYNGLIVRVNDDIDIQVYKSKSEYSYLDFSGPGVKIVSYGTMKGLDFDIVLLSRCEKIRSTGDELIDNHRIYTALTRAREQVYIFYESSIRTSEDWMDFFGPLNMWRKRCILCETAKFIDFQSEGNLETFISELFEEQQPKKLKNIGNEIFQLISKFIESSKQVKILSFEYLKNLQEQIFERMNTCNQMKESINLLYEEEETEKKTMLGKIMAGWDPFLEDYTILKRRLNKINLPMDVQIMAAKYVDDMESLIKEFEDIKSLNQTLDSMQEFFDRCLACMKTSKTLSNFMRGI